MSTEDRLPPKFSLKRWSRRKLEVARAAAAPPPAVAPEAVPPAGDATPATPGPASVLESDTVAMPSVESLTFDSDFTAFLRPKVNEVLKRQALKKLFSDPRFNVMDGLDIYIDDYTKPDPIAPELVRELIQGRGIFGPFDAQGAQEESRADVVPGAAKTPTPAPEEAAAREQAAPEQAAAQAPEVSTASGQAAHGDDAPRADQDTAAPR